MSALLLSLAALLLSSSVHAQFEAAVVSPSGIGAPGAPPPLPTGRADTSASPPQQIDFSAPAQLDFSENAAPQTPPDRDDRMPARRTPASADRRADHPVDERLQRGGIGAALRDATGADNASSPSAAAPRRSTNRRVDDEDASVLLGLPE